MAYVAQLLRSRQTSLSQRGSRWVKSIQAKNNNLIVLCLDRDGRQSDQMPLVTHGAGWLAEMMQHAC